MGEGGVVGGEGGGVFGFAFGFGFGWRRWEGVGFVAREVDCGEWERGGHAFEFKLYERGEVGGREGREGGVGGWV